MNAERRPSAVAETAKVTPAKKSINTVPRNSDKLMDRRQRREQEFQPDVVSYLEQLDRRREAEWRLQRVSDFSAVA